MQSNDYVFAKISDIVYPKVGWSTIFPSLPPPDNDCCELESDYDHNFVQLRMKHAVLLLFTKGTATSN